MKLYNILILNKIQKCKKNNALKKTNKLYFQDVCFKAKNRYLQKRLALLWLIAL